MVKIWNGLGILEIFFKRKGKQLNCQQLRGGQSHFGSLQMEKVGPGSFQPGA